ncbi:MAG: hypothetical protein WA240_01895 [Nitrospirota bacterium]|mgnify:CR=1 FL=1
MKKITVLLLGILMLFAVAADTFAETTVGGTIDVRGRWRENDNDLNKDEYGSTAFWEEKVNLWVDAKIAEGLKGYVELQSDGSDGFTAWGTSRPTSTAAPNSFLNENRSYGAMEIRYAYIDFMIPKTPVGIKIGHFPVVLGHSIWADTSYWGSDGLLIYSSPIKELMIGLGTLKGYETASNTNRSDADLYVLMANYTFMPKNTVGFNASYIYRSGAAGTGKTLANAYWSGHSADGVAFNAINDVKFWNIMLTLDGSLDFGLGYKFEIDKQFGKLDDTEVAGGVDLKGSGLAFLLGASYGIGEIAEVKFNAAYGSGDKCVWAGTETEGAVCPSTGTKYEGYMSFNNYGYTMVYEDIVGQKSAAGTLSSGDFGLYNTMYLNVGAGFTPLKDMSVGLDIYYLRAVKERFYGQKKNLGYEFDLNFGYNIYKNLKWTLLAGYFLPGNHYKALSSTDTVKDDAAWAFEQVLSLSF